MVLPVKWDQGVSDSQLCLHPMRGQVLSLLAYFSYDVSNCSRLPGNTQFHCAGSGGSGRNINMPASPVLVAELPR